MRLELFGQNTNRNLAVHAHVARRLDFALGRLASQVRRVRVTLTDLNGPRGGIDKKCLLVVDLLRVGRVVVEHRAADWLAAAHGAAERLAQSVRRRLALRHRRKRGRTPALVTLYSKEV